MHIWRCTAVGPRVGAFRQQKRLYTEFEAKNSTLSSTIRNRRCICFKPYER